MTIIDSQVHAYEANRSKRPWHSVPNWPDHVTGDEMVAAMDKVGVDGAIFISAFSMYRYDASYAVEVQRAHPGRLAIVKPVDPDDPDVADVVADWKKTPGTVGIRIMLTKEAKRAPDDPGLDRIARAAVRYDFPVNLLCWDNLDAGTALIDRHPDTRFIIDHLGILQPRVPPAPREPWTDLPKVLELARRPNAVIKVSGACTLSREPYPFPDIWDPLARVFDAWGFDRCLWGTDWTRAFAVVNYEQAVEPFLKTSRLSDSERAMLMGGACAKAYGWSPKRGYSRFHATHNSISARWAFWSSTGRNCRRCSVRGRTRARRNSTARHCTSSLAYSPACRGLIPSHHRLERCRWAADDSRGGSRSHASDRRVAWERRTRRLAAATRELRSIGIICATLVQRIRSAVQMRFKSRNASMSSGRRWRSRKSIQARRACALRAFDPKRK
jgi:L-fuconolactonase